MFPDFQEKKESRESARKSKVKNRKKDNAWNVGIRVEPTSQVRSFVVTRGHLKALGCKGSPIHLQQQLKAHISHSFS